MTDHPEMPDDDAPTDAALMDYVRGRLGDAEARDIERAAGQEPRVKADIALLRGIAALRDAPGDAPPGDLGWARLSRAIDADKAVQAAPRRHWRPVLQFAATAVLAVGVWQFGILPNMPGSGPDDVFVPVSETPSGAVTVAFVPVATEAEIRTLLQEIGADITGGPNALGLWQISFADETARNEGLRRLALETAIVESVQAD